VAIPESVKIALLEQLGATLFNEAADAALGTGVLKVALDSTGFTGKLKRGTGPSILLEKIKHDSKGVSGRIFVDAEDLKNNPLSVTLFDNFKIEMTVFDLTLLHNAFVDTAISGKLTIPFFTDSDGTAKTVDIDLGLAADGSLSITISDDPANLTSEGLLELSYDIGPTELGANITIHVSSIEVDRTKDNVWRLLISGNLFITTEDIVWPTFELRGLGIDSNGKISLEGGWIDLPSQFTLDFHGFHVGLTRLGFGSDVDSAGKSVRWAGFNGDIKLVDGFTLGGSIRGMRINLETGSVSFDGVGIAFEIPDTISIDGEIDHIQIRGALSGADYTAKGLLPSLYDYLHASGASTDIDVFAGQVSVVVEAVGGLEIDAHFIVGHFGGVSVFFLAVEADLPTGIVIFTDVSLYGLAGLFASNLEPNPAATNNSWWEWYKFPAGTTGINISGIPDFSANDVNKWMVPKQGALAFGVGAIIGTAADDGRTVSAAVTLILMLPGPTIMLVGKANILSKRISGAQAEANFEALAVYDGNAGTFDLAIDAQYSIPAVLNIEAHAELYVDPPDWFFAIGRPPHDKRVKARIFDLFEVDAYFVVSDKGLVTGSWVGYRNLWDYGPLSVKIDAFMAMLLAIQWSPLQFAGGLEIHGQVELEAFGIGLGITADALLEGCAPNPFWVYGQFDVEIDLPWPLSDIGATVRIEYGGDDGSVPPPPLALNTVGATLVDHTDAAGSPTSDAYALLGHTANGPSPDTVKYDINGRPGILQSPVPAVRAFPDLPNDLQSKNLFAPVVPQDAHFALTFAHPVEDGVGFSGRQTVSPESAVASIPSSTIVGADDMSNIIPNPPSVHWQYRHTLVGVAIYEYMAGGWSEICALPPIAPQAGTTLLGGAWLAPQQKNSSSADYTPDMTQLKVFPYRLLPGITTNAEWFDAPLGALFPVSFRDQGLEFIAGNGFTLPHIGTENIPLAARGIVFTVGGPVQSASLHIRFPSPVTILSITSLLNLGVGGVPRITNPNWMGDGIFLSTASIAQNPSTHAFTQSLPATGQPITDLSVSLGAGTLILHAITYRTADIPMAILPMAPALYAVKTVTRIEAGRVNGGTPNFISIGNDIVEFAYVQTVSGPGTTVIPPLPNPPFQVPSMPWPVPAQQAAYPTLVTQVNTAQQPLRSFPLGGALEDLATYTQWSWPENGALAAYYGYDVNVEFTESYVSALYTTFSGGDIRNSLHFRCVDRNHEHTLLRPIAIQVPSMPLQSAVVAGRYAPDLPSAITKWFPAADAPTATTVSERARAELEKRAASIDTANDPKALPPELQQTQLSPTVIAALNAPSGSTMIQQMSPAHAAELLLDLHELDAAAQVIALWFKPLAPRTRYTLDVVAGPFAVNKETPSRSHNPSSQIKAPIPSLPDPMHAQDATAALVALTAYYAYEDSLTTLESVQFTTSRYATFSDQVANVAKQVQGLPGVTPVRRYARQAAVLAPQLWVADPSHSVDMQSYLVARAALADLVAHFSPIADERFRAPTTALLGNVALSTQRLVTTAAWQLFSKATSASFDGLIAALGRPDLVSTAIPIVQPSPDTEISLFTDATGNHVEAILLESPEPLPWQRIWQWISLLPANSQSQGVTKLAILWNNDGTRGIIVPFGNPLGSFHLQISFQGNIGAEAPCITASALGVTEHVNLGTLTLGPISIRRPGPIPIPIPTPILRPTSTILVGS